LKAKQGKIAKFWNIVTILLFVTSALNLAYLIYVSVKKQPEVTQEDGFTIFVNPATHFTVMKTRIAIALIVSVVGWLISKRRGLQISAFALCWIIVEYVAWWIRSVSAVKESASASFAKVEHVAFLLHANWWDIWTLAIVTLMLINEIRLLIGFESHQLPRPIR